MKEKTLTKAEEQVMHILWKLEKGFVNDILKEMPSPKPSYNTVSTIVRILEKKQFVSYKAYGKTHEYFPAISKKEYTNITADKMLKNYFEGSFEKMISFFVKEKKLKVNDLDDILKMLDKQGKRK